MSNAALRCPICGGVNFEIRGFLKLYFWCIHCRQDVFKLNDFGDIDSLIDNREVQLRDFRTVVKT